MEHHLRFRDYLRDRLRDYLRDRLRDYLRDHLQDATKYGQIKRAGARRYPTDISA